jgi:uncharacterized protein (DUF1684 family)
VARLALVALIAGLLGGSACSAAPKNYPDEIAAHRAEVDAFMRGSSDSPIPEAQRASFQPLPYYPIDEQYRVPAGLRVARGDEVIEMSTSTGKPRRMRRIGTLAFTLKGQPLTLTAFAEADDTKLQRLFVPFGDLTNGIATYQGGRYLDLDLKGSGVYELDFNRAYHPYCVFNPQYECPVPPRENRLTVPILAGERNR